MVVIHVVLAVVLVVVVHVVGIVVFLAAILVLVVLVGIVTVFFTDFQVAGHVGNRVLVGIDDIHGDVFGGGRGGAGEQR